MNSSTHTVNNHIKKYLVDDPAIVPPPHQTPLPKLRIKWQMMCWRASPEIEQPPAWLPKS